MNFGEPMRRKWRVTHRGLVPTYQTFESENMFIREGFVYFTDGGEMVRPTNVQVIRADRVKEIKEMTDD